MFENIKIILYFKMKDYLDNEIEKFIKMFL